MHKSDNIGQLAAALAGAQAGFDSIKRDRTVKVKTRTGGEYTFSYAPLDTVLAAIRPALSKQGLTLLQSVEHDEHGAQVLRTTLLHASGEWLANDTSIILGREAGPQEYGSALTYAARYGVTRLLCLASEEDDDGNLASGNHAERVKRDAKPAAKKVPVITEETVAMLSRRIEELGVNQTDFCRFLGVPDLAELPASALMAAQAALDKKAEKTARDKAAAAAEEAE